MILKYGMKNFSSFKEGVEICFELKKSVRNKFNNKVAADVLCVNGANGSGKTNLLKGLAFLAQFCANSFNYKPDDEIPMESYFFNDEPTEFYIELLSRDSEYRYKYECAITSKKVLFEKLYRKKKKEVAIVERAENKILDCINDFEALCGIKKIRNNASIISIANQHEIESIAPFYDFFSFCFSNVSFIGLTLTPFIDEEKVTEFYQKDKELFDFVKSIICKSDLGISDIKIEQYEREDGKVRYFPVFQHPNQNLTRILAYQHESSGTKALYLNLFRYHVVLGTGGVLIMDEFDINLHPHMLPTLLECFTDPEINKHDAQLIFTTHNIDILNIMGKYRTFLVNKKDNESFGYRLDEIPGDILRNDRDISPFYDSGKIGGIPKL
jgi:hypothetical protein